MVETNAPEVKQADAAASAGVGRIKGWKERLDLMRKQKQQQIEESRIGISETNESKNEEANKTLTDIFAPAAGLERNEDGKLKVDQDKAEKKKEIEFEPPKKDEESKKTEAEELA